MAAAGLALAGPLAACPGEVPSGGSCSSTSDCESGLQCRYPLGSGCGARGQCDVPTSDCDGTASGLVLCACGASLDLACIPSSVTLTVRSATGTACLADAGDAGDAGDASDAGD